MRQPILWLLAAIVVSAQQSPQEASRARFQRNTLVAIDAWIGGGAPPGPWRVTSPSNVTDVKHPLQRHGIVKAISSGRVGDLQVVVKRARRDEKPKRRDAEKRAHALALAHAKDELAFLESLRGRRGVPLLASDIADQFALRLGRASSGSADFGAIISYFGPKILRPRKIFEIFDPNRAEKCAQSRTLRRAAARQ